MCLRFVLMTTLQDVKLHSKERNEDSNRRCLSTGEDPSVKRQVWLRTLISESWGLCSRLGLRTPGDTRQTGPPLPWARTEPGCHQHQSRPAGHGAVRAGAGPGARLGAQHGERCAPSKELHRILSLLLTPVNYSAGTERQRDNPVGPKFALWGTWK